MISQLPLLCRRAIECGFLERSGFFFQLRLRTCPADHPVLRLFVETAYIHIFRAGCISSLKRNLYYATVTLTMFYRPCFPSSCGLLGRSKMKWRTLRIQGQRSVMRRWKLGAATHTADIHLMLKYTLNPHPHWLSNPLVTIQMKRLRSCQIRVSNPGRREKMSR